VVTLSPALAYEEPQRRALQIYAVDPMMSRLSGNEVTTITVPYEPLEPGPSGQLIQVVDYDTTTKTHYAPVDLDDPALLVRDGLAPSEGDPRFHQQMVYAVASSLIENFERGLGRRFRWRGSGRRLKFFPHAFRGENALYDPTGGGSVQFGYFRTDPRNPGRNLPGQYVYSCLSHDIIVHETTHALVDRLRRWYREPSNADVYAFHEGFADAVALFQHFSLPGLLDRYIQQNRTDLSARSPLVELAQQFGEATGQGKALRDALGDEPDPARLARSVEPHERGSILVAAIFDAFFATYQAAIADLVRLSSAGTGQLGLGALHPDLVARVAAEARDVSHRLLMMCIRAFQYLPPVDVTFGDFLRSAVTADRDLFPEDVHGMRSALVEGFRKRGIYPTGVSGLADEAVAWPSAASLNLPPLDRTLVIDPLVRETSLGYVQGDEVEPTRAQTQAIRAGKRATTDAITEWAEDHANSLGLVSGLPIDVEGFHALFRMGSGGTLRVNVVIQLTQLAAPELRQSMAGMLAGIPLRGGATIVADVDGTILHVVSRATPSQAPDAHPQAGQRIRSMADFVDHFDTFDLPGPWRSDVATAKFGDAAYRNGLTTRIAATLTLGQLDRGYGW
jgi:hypothetical protein